jgi:type I restriction enzyme, S subunit
MIADLKPYPEYKDSGLPWLGQVPGHWEVRRLKQTARFVYGDALPQTGRSMGEVPVYGSNGRVGWHSNGNALPPCIIVGRKGSFGKVNYCQDASFVIDTAFFIDARVTKANLRWLYYALSWIGLDRISKDSAVPGLDRDDAYQQLAVVPPPSEQAAIVRFLDWANGRLERAIRAKRKIVALLNEQKQAIIHRAVTRGLDPNVRLKDSGIPWLGEIPEHWEVIPLGRLCISRCDGPFGSGLKSAHYTDSGVRVIRLQNIGSGMFRNCDGAFISTAHYATLGDHGVINGDLLIAGLGDERIPAGRACVAPRDLGLAMVKADCFRFRVRESIAVTQFLAVQLSATALGASACLSTGATRLRINLSMTASRSVAIPPVAEQHELLTSIDLAVAPLIGTISRLEREIDLLREYRTRLVADVVTGKLDVREVAATLPDDSLHDAAPEEDLDSPEAEEPLDQEEDV